MKDKWGEEERTMAGEEERAIEASSVRRSGMILKTL